MSYINPYSFATGVSIPLAADAPGSSANASGWQDILTLTVTAAQQTANADIIVFWNSSVAYPNTSNNLEVRLTQDGTEIVKQVRLNSAADFTHFGGFIKFNAGATPADKVFKIQCQRAGGTATLSWRESRLLAFKMGAHDVYAENLVDLTSTTTTFATGCTLTFTPGSTGDYLFIGCCNLNGGATSSTTSSARLRHSGASLQTLLTEVGSGGQDRKPAVQIWKRTSLSGSQTVTWEYNRAAGSNVAGAGQFRILGLRISDLTQIAYVEQGADNTGTDTSYATALTQTWTPNAAYHLTLASWEARNNSDATNFVDTRLLDDATSVAEARFDPRGTNWVQHFAMNVANYAAASRTQAVQRKAGSGAISQTVRGGASMVAIELTGRM